MDRLLRWCETIFHLIVVLLVVRVVAYAVGYTAHVPILDSIISGIFTMVKNFGNFIGTLLGFL